MNRSLSNKLRVIFHPNEQGGKIIFKPIEALLIGAGIIILVGY